MGQQMADMGVDPEDLPEIGDDESIRLLITFRGTWTQEEFRRHAPESAAELERLLTKYGE